MAKLSYVYDPLCGWCYGFVPTLKQFVETHPDVTVEVIPGGLVTGSRIGPYGNMLDYISKAAPGMTAVTGQALGEAFFDMMRGEQTPLSISAPPSLAVIKMKSMTSAQNTLSFAEALLVEHFSNGRDLNDPATYDALCAKLDLPHLDMAEIITATDDHPEVAQSYRHARHLGVTSFPTSIVWDDAGQNRGVIKSIYDPAKFVQAFQARLAD